MAENNAPDWIPEDLLSNVSLHKFDTPEALAKSYVELESWKGGAIRIPGEDAGDTSRAEFHQKLMDSVPGLMHRPDTTNDEQMALYHESIGVPKETAGYSQDAVEGLEDVTLNKTRDMALAANLTPGQHKAVTAWLATESGEVNEAVSQAETENSATIKETLGQSTEQRMNRIESIARGKGMEVSTAGIPAHLILFIDSLIDDTQGQPQGHDQGGVDVGPNVTELKERVSERMQRLMDDPNMPRDQYVSLLEANNRDREAINASG